MTFVLFFLIFAAAWSLAAGKNLSTIRNYGLNRVYWGVPAIAAAPFTFLALTAMVMSRDDLKERRQLLQFENKLDNAKKEEMQMNRLLE